MNGRLGGLSSYLRDAVRGWFGRAPRPSQNCGWATPFLVTRNSAKWIIPLLQIYRDAGLEPFVLVDDRSTDGTAAALRRARFRFREVRSTVDRAEPMVREIRREFPTGWLLRMDDDEVPSIKMIEFLLGPEPGEGVNVIGFPRRYYSRDGAGQIFRGRWTPRCHLYEDMKHDWQYRLFRSENVEFTDRLHTPCFVVPTDPDRAPADAFIAHFVWVLRTLEERRQKIATYNIQIEFGGSFFRPVYVPEDANPGEVLMFKARSTEFDEIAKVFAAVPASAVGEPG